MFPFQDPDWKQLLTIAYISCFVKAYFTTAQRWWLKPALLAKPDIPGFLVAQMVKNLLTVQETQVQSLGWEEPLEKSMETPSSILAWRIPWTVEPGGLQSLGLQRFGHNWATDYSSLLSVDRKGPRFFS